MSDVTPLVIFGRTEEEIRENMDLVANQGLDPNDPERVHTAVGSPFWFDTQPVVVEIAKAYDRMNEAVRAAFVTDAWGDFLDRHAESVSRFRLPATKAVGELTIAGADGTLIPSGSRYSPEQTEADVDPPEFETTAPATIGVSGTIDVPIQAVLAGQEGNVASGLITIPLTGPSDVVVTNAAATASGSDDETDPALRARLISIYRGNIWGTANWYRNVALEYPGVGKVRVIPHRDGAGTVALIVFDVDGNPAGALVTDGLKAALDPEPGSGEGLAPAEHYVTVETGEHVDVYVSATIEHESGYTLDGAGVTVATEAAIEAAVAEYMDGLQAGEEVVYNRVRAVILGVEGVHDVPSLFVEANDATPDQQVDVPMADAGPPQVATLAGITLAAA